MRGKKKKENYVKRGTSESGMQSFNYDELIGHTMEPLPQVERIDMIIFICNAGRERLSVFTNVVDELSLILTRCRLGTTLLVRTILTVWYTVAASFQRHAFAVSTPQLGRLIALCHVDLSPGYLRVSCVCVRACIIVRQMDKRMQQKKIKERKYETYEPNLRYIKVACKLRTLLFKSSSQMFDTNK